MLRNTRIVLLSVLSFGLPSSALASICDGEELDLLGEATCARLDADAAVLEAAGLSPLAPVVLAAPVQEEGDAAWIEAVDGRIALEEVAAFTLRLEDNLALGLAVGLLAEGEQGLMLALPGERLLALDGVGLVAVGVTNDHRGVDLVAVGVTNDHRGSTSLVVGRGAASRRTHPPRRVSPWRQRRLLHPPGQPRWRSSSLPIAHRACRAWR